MAVDSAALSQGASNEVIHRLVARVVGHGAIAAPQPTRYETVVDVGCGKGAASFHLTGGFARYVGCDAFKYAGFPDAGWASFVNANLDQMPYPLPDASADLVLAIEVIEHLENPRGFVRELVRIVKPGGRLVITTPNQLSLLSKLTFLRRNQFNAFQEAPGLYPSHITALLEEDLIRIARECHLTDISVHYTDHGRIPFTPRHWPSRFRGRAFSDNILVTGLRPL